MFHSLHCRHVIQVFHNTELQEGLQSWSELPVREQDPYSSDKMKRLGFLKLTEKEVAKDPPVDTIIGNQAIERIDQLADAQDEAFFLAVGFRCYF